MAAKGFGVTRLEIAGRTAKQGQAPMCYLLVFLWVRLSGVRGEGDENPGFFWGRLGGWDEERKGEMRVCMGE